MRVICLTCPACQRRVALPERRYRRAPHRPVACPSCGTRFAAGSLFPEDLAAAPAWTPEGGGGDEVVDGRDLGGASLAGEDERGGWTIAGLG